MFLAKGNVERFKHVIELGRVDYRDVLWQTEYDCGEEKLFDVNKWFHELKLTNKLTNEKLNKQLLRDISLVNSLNAAKQNVRLISILIKENHENT